MPITCSALDEIAAEKWVALTRRLAETKIKSRQSDQHLVRHLYDLHQLHQANRLTGEHLALIDRIMQQDRQQFSKRNSNYAIDPIATSKAGLETLQNDPAWETAWDKFLFEMVYGNDKPTFTNACGRLNSMSDKVFATLEAEPATV